MKPDWRDAPEWANWVAMDEDGTWFWYELEPELYPEENLWDVVIDGELSERADSPIDWKNSLEQRPKSS